MDGAASSICSGAIASVVAEKNATKVQDCENIFLNIFMNIEFQGVKH